MIKALPVYVTDRYYSIVLKTKYANTEVSEVCKYLRVVNIYVNPIRNFLSIHIDKNMYLYLYNTFIM